ncbi:MAG: DUF885 family protein [Bernardetiaceae bacterium]|nr:DUF885 family protein [Bernardetiaceae bacterium]
MIIRTVLLSIILIAMLWVINLVFYKPFSIEVFYERMFFEFGLEDPELMSRLRILDNVGITFHNSKLKSIAAKDKEKRYDEFVVRNMNLLLSYKRSKQNERQLFHTEFLNKYLNDAVYLRNFEASMQNYEINHIKGEHIQTIDFMIRVHQIYNLQDAKNYISRLAAIPKKIKQLKQNISDQAMSGIRTPVAMYDKVLMQIDSFLVPDVKSNVLYKDFLQKINKATYLRPTARYELEQEAFNLIKYELYPEYRDLKAFIEQDDFMRIDSIGVNEISGGDFYYLHLFYIYNQISDNALGENQSYFEGQKQKALRHIEYLDKSLKTEMFALGYDTTQFDAQKSRAILQEEYQTSDKISDQAYLDTVRFWVDKAYSLLPNMLDDYTKAELSVEALNPLLEDRAEVMEYKKELESDNPKLYVNLKRIREIPMYNLPYHVATEVAKHVLYWHTAQIAKNPSFRRVIHFEVYREGIGMFLADKLCELDYLETNLNKVGMIKIQALQAVRLYCDIQIHIGNISRQEAIEFMQTHSYLSKKQAEDEVDRISAVPSEMAIYQIGYWYFEELEQRMKRDFKNKYKPQMLYKLILKDGDMPFSILEKQYERLLIKQGLSNK